MFLVNKGFDCKLFSPFLNWTYHLTLGVKFGVMFFAPFINGSGHI